ncbi:Aspartate--tRNA(Asp/Asn) ligase [Candidatus Kinetoplastibacterium sorsogonicusi]|uniref:Aspartate--tRNA(Asp/Asn) ligase n=1 Tax=Candidatus Kinetoplastidibacterium kentomonadis TaxID=1576550 RepID=A0A3S7JAQ8_9PROT|nr:aspartate--tRNA ligase [Candidatus Kinetoplastibacterium sorsogonicusi]AWD32758.1 Aspartate--tRNA(Asp/Asn) ligase [Candidatus Kinetoplastibacterium sorsogonicusi]
MRTFYNGLIRTSHIGKNVSLCGWVNRRRDHGGVIFIDLRDHTGIVQLVFSPENKFIFQKASQLRNEYCINVLGIVNLRPIESYNKEIESGEVEILCHELNILNVSITPPFNIDDNNILENTRLSYRYLDLRSSKMQKNLRTRYQVTMEIRKFLDKLNFIDIETPFLTKSTPEGARDYLIPSRINIGNFYALPQSPQLFKQLLMISGFDRYYQIVKCFRDEDLRADRQPEFTQIDCEMSFINEEEIRNLFENMIIHIFKTIINVNLPNKFPTITWKESIDKYGTDKPDLRINLELINITEITKTSSLKIFSDIALNNGKVVALKVPQGAIFSRKEIEFYTNYVMSYGAKGLAYIKINDIKKGYEGLQSPIVKNLSIEELNQIFTKIDAKNNDIVFFGADKESIVNSYMGALRLKIGISDFSKRNNIFKDQFCPLWVIDFPMFEFDENKNKYTSIHHPFTSPKQSIDELRDIKPDSILSKSYDLVINGWEIGGGSIRIHHEEMQRKIFNILGISNEEAHYKFGFLLEALKYGAPPHGGIAFGLDRLVSIMVNAESIREVIAFPKTQRAQCLLTQAPSEVEKEQLIDLHINISKNI